MIFIQFIYLFGVAQPTDAAMQSLYKNIEITQTKLIIFHTAISNGIRHLLFALDKEQLNL